MRIEQNFHSNYFSNEVYQYQGYSIYVSAREIIPSVEHDRNHAVVLFLGWGADSRAESYEGLSYSLAANFGRRVIIVETKPDDIAKPTLFAEAACAYDFLESLGITKAVIAGYSQGGIKATDFTAICQKNGKIEPEALMLVASLGIDTLPPGKLVRNFLGEVAYTPAGILGNYFRPSQRQEGEISTIQKFRQLASVAKDFKNIFLDEVDIYQTLGYLGRLLFEILEMSQKNSLMKDINVPVILFLGENDRLTGPKGDLKRALTGRQYSDDSLNQALQDIFPHSPQVELKWMKGNHFFGLFLAEQIAKEAADFLRGKNPII